VDVLWERACRILPLAADPHGPATTVAATMSATAQAPWRWPWAWPSPRTPALLLLAYLTAASATTSQRCGWKDLSTGGSARLAAQFAMLVQAAWAITSSACSVE
jgi:hypothetical protein